MQAFCFIRIFPNPLLDFSELVVYIASPLSSSTLLLRHSQEKFKIS